MSIKERAMHDDDVFSIQWHDKVINTNYEGLFGWRWFDPIGTGWVELFLYRLFGA